METLTTATKMCRDCGEDKPLDEFYKSKPEKDGLQRRCKVCTKTRMKAQYARDPEKRRETARSSAMRNRLKIYGMSQHEWQQMVVAQGGVCKVCRRDVELQVDHCHAGGGVRGLLCGECNRALGLVRDDVDVLLALVEYLRAHERAAA